MLVQCIEIKISNILLNVQELDLVDGMVLPKETVGRVRAVLVEVLLMYYPMAIKEDDDKRSIGKLVRDQSQLC